jgi:hypothetical protein
VKYLKTHIIYLLSLLVLSYNVQAQEVLVNASIKNNAIKIGEQTTITLSAIYTAQSGKHISIIWPEIKDSISSKIEVVESFKTDTIVNDSITPLQIKYFKNITITSFDSGTWVIPPFKFLTSNDTQAIFTNPLQLQVQTISVDTTLAIKDIKPIIEVDYSIIDWIKDNALALSIGLIVAILIVIAVYFLRKKLKNKPEETVVDVPKLPAHVIALEKLNKLKEEKLWQQEKTKQYYIELTNIIREYIENRFKIQALEQTSDEILISFRNTAIDDESIQKLKQILLLSDLVKFAKERPLPSENELSMNNTFAFIEGTLREEDKK